MITLTKTEATRFLLLRQGLMGPRSRGGKAAVLERVRDLGSVQFDPINVFGRSADLTLLARIEGYRPDWLRQLLYEDRRLCDYYDKCMCVFPVEDLPYFSRTRRMFEEHPRGREALQALRPAILALASEKEYVTSADLDDGARLTWSWGRRASLANAAAERLFHEGKLVIHHKTGNQRAYSLPETVGLAEHLTAPDPNITEEQYHDWAILRRVGAVGLLPDRGSDAFLSIIDLDASKRHGAFARLTERGALLPVEVEGKTYYLAERHKTLLEQARTARPGTRCELLAPLDNLLWDRRLIRELFGFDYKWEIYTPAKDRRYGYYVVPVLYGERFVGRAEPVMDRAGGALSLKNFWPEEGFRASGGFRRALEGTLSRLARMNGIREVRIECSI